MSKSQVEEIVAVLWFILASQTYGLVRGFAIGWGLYAIVASLYLAGRDRE